MGDSTGGTPGHSGINDMKQLLEKTKVKYNLIHPNENKWPCPFCLSKEKTFIQCKIHIKKEHPNLLKVNERDLLSQFENTLIDNEPQTPPPNDATSNATPNDLKKFLDLINESITNVKRKDENEGTNNENLSHTNTFNLNYDEDEDEEVFYCPYNCKSKKSFQQLRGLNIHIGRMHPGKKKIRREDIEYEYAPNGFEDLNDFGQHLAYLRSTTATLRRCPKGARKDLAASLTNVVRRVVNENNEQSWNNLLLFPYATLRIPNKDENVTNLTSFVRQNIKSWDEGKVDIIQNITTNRNIDSRKNNIFKKAEAKLSDGDINGAIRLISSDDCMAPNNEDTLSSLNEKHPPHPEPAEFPDSAIEVDQIEPTEEEVRRTIWSFRNGTAGGLDSLRPQILKDLLNIHNGDISNTLLATLTSLFKVILSGSVPASICPYLYGATLTALQKLCGGIRPIAVGNIWRRTAAKLTCRRVSSKLCNTFQPNQIGVGIKNGAEAGAHAARVFFNSKHKSIKIFLKIDVKNAFNEVRRDVVLREVKEKIPEIFKFVEQCYKLPTNVYYGKNLILSRRGVQQGDPLGPALFCLALQRIISSLQLLELDLNLWYLDDGTIAGSPDVVLNAFHIIIEKADEIGLSLNHRKCEMAILGQYTTEDKITLLDLFDKVSPGIQEIELNNAFLLGCPLTDQAAVVCLDRKINNLQNFTKKLTNISAHSAYFLLRMSITIPRLIFFLRGNPMWRNNIGLQRYDDVLKESLETILNVQLTPRAWAESSLPIKMGGIGIRHATEMALPCFLSSINEVSNLVDKLLSEPYRQIDPARLEAEDIWCKKFGELPHVELRNVQKIWESHNIAIKIESIRNSLERPTDKARFLANSISESGAWMQALPSPQLGTHLTNDEFRIILALRLGSPIVQRHICVCGDVVDIYGLHGLSCSKASGTNPRHAFGNNIIQRGLRTANFPAVLEPPGCSRPDGKQPDGMTLIPWERGRSLLWDFTCRDTFAQSYLNGTSKCAGHLAKLTERKKIDHYSHLADHFVFIPIAVETSGVIGDIGLKFLKKIGSKITEVTNEKRSTAFLIQRMSVAIQKGNAASIMGTIPPSKNLNEIFYL